MSTKNVPPKNQSLQPSSRNFWIYIAGIALVAMSVLLFLAIFYPVLKEEVKYQIFSAGDNIKVESQKDSDGTRITQTQTDTIIPVDEEFGIAIPKISANAKVIPEVDSQDPAIYQRALTQGVAHAKGTAYPGEGGNIFIFAHSSADFWEASRYNAVFYLISKLEKGDEVDIFFKHQKYLYIVKDKKTVNSDDVKYLDRESGNQLALMTCWPPGTTLKRLLVIARPSSSL